MPQNGNSNSGLPDWLHAVMREAAIRQGIILDGHVRDLFYDPQQRQYVTLPELLIRLFMRDRSLGFTLAGVWDRADGLRFPDPRSARRFNEALSGTHRNRSAKDSPSDSYDVGNDNATRSTGTKGVYPDPGELLPAIRRVLEQSSERPVFVLDWTHLLVTQPSNPDSDERQWMLQLSKTLVGGPVVPMDSDHLRQPSGLIVFLTANLSSLPLAIYHGDPRIRVLAVPSPSRTERRAFFLRHMDDLRCERPKAAAGSTPAGAGGCGRDELADSLADLTDQLTAVDLRQILSLSLQTDTPLAPHRLLNVYRFGEQRSPWEELSEQKLHGVEEALKKRVIGQDAAVYHVATMIIRAYMGLAGLQHSGRRSKPKGTLFFVGPTGVGKTELAKACAEFLFGDELACIRFDMSEYNHEHSDQRLVGAPPGYVGFEQGGQLTNAVRQRPFCVILLDEIEKAHLRILDKFLQILEDGRLTDGRGETTHFSECVIIFTSNIGGDEMPETNDLEQLRMHFVRSVEKYFTSKLGRPELLNRLGDNIVVFDPIIDDGVRRQILERQLESLRADLHERFGIGLRLSEELEQYFVQSARPEHGGRGVVNALEHLVNPLARFLLTHKHQLRRGRVVLAMLGDDGVAFEVEEELSRV